MSSPTGLKPQVSTKRLGKRVMVAAALAVGIMFIIMVYSLQNKKKAQEPVQSSVQITTPALDENDDFGISDLPAPPKEVLQKPEIAKKTEPKKITIIKPTHSAESKKRYNAELAQIRNWRISKQLKAIEAPMLVAQATITKQSPQKADMSSSSHPGRRSSSSSGSSGVDTSTLHDQIASLSEQRNQGTNEYGDKIDKEDFSNRSHNDEWSSPYRRVPGSRFELKTGAIIPGIMLTGIHSDLPGQITAQVSQNVWDTATGRYLLIPQGTRILGQYDSRIVTGQERVLIAWNRLIFPDGSSITLGSMPGADQSGQAGFYDEVDNHYFRIFGNALVMSLITGVASYATDALAMNTGSDSNPTIQSQLGTSLAQTLSQAGMAVLQKNLNISPTLEIRPGYRFNVIVVKDLIFKEPYEGWR